MQRSPLCGVKLPFSGWLDGQVKALSGSTPSLCTTRCSDTASVDRLLRTHPAAASSVMQRRMFFIDAHLTGLRTLPVAKAMPRKLVINTYEDEVIRGIDGELCHLPCTE